MVGVQVELVNGHQSTWIIPPPLGSNGPHCVEFLHEMRKLLLNLVLGEPLAC